MKLTIKDLKNARVTEITPDMEPERVAIHTGMNGLITSCKACLTVLEHHYAKGAISRQTYRDSKSYLLETFSNPPVTLRADIKGFHKLHETHPRKVPVVKQKAAQTSAVVKAETRWATPDARYPGAQLLGA